MAIVQTHRQYHGAKPNLPEDLPDLAWTTRRGHQDTAWKVVAKRAFSTQKDEGSKESCQEIARLLTEYERTGAPPAHSLQERE